MKIGAGMSFVLISELADLKLIGFCFDDRVYIYETPVVFFLKETWVTGNGQLDLFITGTML